MTRARDVANVLTAANVLSTDIESAAAISAHTGITDPHPAYLQESTFSANQIVYKNASNEATGSANLTFSGSDLAVAGTIRSTASAGDEGGEIFLNKSTTNTTLTGGVVLDVNQNRLRIFEEGGSNRGYYLDIASGGTSVGTNLGSSGGMTLISTTTLSGASVSISSIPTTYKDLYVVIYGVTNATGNGHFRCAPNGTTNITQSLSTVGISSVSHQTANNTYLFLGDSETIYGWTRTVADNSVVLLISNYSGTSSWKSFRYTSAFDANSYGYAIVNGVGTIKTNSAITSLVFSNSFGNLSTGTLLLYGVK
jgi:hypothetical protein